jgi:hypothetical protein
MEEILSIEAVFPLTRIGRVRPTLGPGSDPDPEDIAFEAAERGPGRSEYAGQPFSLW